MNSMVASTDHSNRIAGDGSACQSTKPSKTSSQYSGENKKSSHFFMPLTHDQKRSLVSSLARHTIGHQLTPIVEVDSKYFELWWSGIACDDKVVAEVVNELSYTKYDYIGTTKEAIARRHEARPAYSHSTINKIRTQLLEGEEMEIINKEVKQILRECRNKIEDEFCEIETEEFEAGMRKWRVD